MDKLNIFKGCKKWTFYDIMKRAPMRTPKRIIPKDYITASEMLWQKYMNIKLSIKFLCIEWFGDEDYFENIIMHKIWKFKWFINNNQITKYFRNNPDSILFSSNFDNNNWSLFCRYFNKSTYKKGKRFFIGLMLLKLPWFINYIKIKIIIKCKEKQNENENKDKNKDKDKDNKKYTKMFVSKVWPGFEASLQIPFKNEIIQKASSLNITILIEILKVFDIHEKEISSQQWKDFKII